MQQLGYVVRCQWHARLTWLAVKLLLNAHLVVHDVIQLALVSPKTEFCSAWSSGSGPVCIAHWERKQHSSCLAVQAPAHTSCGSALVVIDALAALAWSSLNIVTGRALLSAGAAAHTARALSWQCLAGMSAPAVQSPHCLLVADVGLSQSRTGRAEQCSIGARVHCITCHQPVAGYCCLGKPRAVLQQGRDTDDPKWSHVGRDSLSVQAQGRLGWHALSKCHP